jgi:hypothetical protein
MVVRVAQEETVGLVALGLARITAAAAAMPALLLLELIQMQYMVEDLLVLTLVR